MIDLPEALRNLEKIHTAGENSWQACCPCHEDKSPSLSITLSCDKILLYCHAGCATENIVAAIGLEMKNLFLGESLQKALRNETEYKYTDEKDAYLFSVVRVEIPGNPKTFYVKTAAGYGLNGARRVLYHLPKIAKAIAEEELIFIAEGEKDVENLEKIGLCATTNSGGAGKWLPEYSESLRWGKIVILPDNDLPGRKHGLQVANALQGIAREVKILELPGLPAKGDVTDWLLAGGTKEALIDLAGKTPIYDSATTTDTDTVENISSPDAILSLVYAPSWDNIPPETPPILTLSDTRICSPGNMTLLIAQHGSGKSTLGEVTCAARITPSADTFGIKADQKGLFYYVDTEQSKQDHAKLWLRTMKRANVENGTVPQNLRFELIKMLPNLAMRKCYLENIVATPDLALLILDGLGDFVRDVNDPGECNEFLFWLLSEATKREFGILATIHHNPADHTGKKARGHLGSEAMRRSESVFTIKRVRENGDIRTLTTNFDYGKNRSASDSLSTSFTWDDGAGMFISCDTPEKKPAAQKKRDVLLEQLRELQPTYNYTALAEAIMVKTGKSIAAAKSQITRFSNAGKIIRDGDLWKIAPNDDFFTMDGGNE